MSTYKLYITDMSVSEWADLWERYHLLPLTRNYSDGKPVYGIPATAACLTGIRNYHDAVCADQLEELQLRGIDPFIDGVQDCVDCSAWDAEIESALITGLVHGFDADSSYLANAPLFYLGYAFGQLVREELVTRGYTFVKRTDEQGPIAGEIGVRSYHPSGAKAHQEEYPDTAPDVY